MNNTAKKTSMLLHACCAPCCCYVYELLVPDFDVTAYFFNPNIVPPEELKRRLSELERFSKMKSFQLIEETGSVEEWNAAVEPFALYGERSKRCQICFRFRLEAAFRKALLLDIHTVATTLSISPHKDAASINRIGAELAKKFGIDFYEADFKKHDGYKKSVELSKLYGFYRQDYCGCIYSKMERDKNSEWAEKVRLFKEKAEFR